MKKMIVIIAAVALAIVTGCTTGDTEAKARVKADVATVLRIAYEVGGKAAVNAKVDELATDGKLSGEQAAALKAVADEACAILFARLTGAEEIPVVDPADYPVVTPVEKTDGKACEDCGEGAECADCCDGTACTDCTPPAGEGTACEDCTLKE